MLSTEAPAAPRPSPRARSRWVGGWVGGRAGRRACRGAQQLRWATCARLRPCARARAAPGGAAGAAQDLPAPRPACTPRGHRPCVPAPAQQAGSSSADGVGARDWSQEIRSIAGAEASGGGPWPLPRVCRPHLALQLHGARLQAPACLQACTAVAPASLPAGLPQLMPWHPFLHITPFFLAPTRAGDSRPVAASEIPSLLDGLGGFEDLGADARPTPQLLSRAAGEGRTRRAPSAAGAPPARAPPVRAACASPASVRLVLGWAQLRPACMSGSRNRAGPSTLRQPRPHLPLLQAARPHAQAAPSPPPSSGLKSRTAWLTLLPRRVAAGAGAERQEAGAGATRLRRHVAPLPPACPPAHRAARPPSQGFVKASCKGGTNIAVSIAVGTAMNIAGACSSWAPRGPSGPSFLLPGAGQGSRGPATPPGQPRTAPACPLRRRGAGRRPGGASTPRLGPPAGAAIRPSQAAPSPTCSRRRWRATSRRGAARAASPAPSPTPMWVPWLGCWGAWGAAAVVRCRRGEWVRSISRAITDTSVGAVNIVLPWLAVGRWELPWCEAGPRMRLLPACLPSSAHSTSRPQAFASSLGNGDGVANASSFSIGIGICIPGRRLRA